MFTWDRHKITKNPYSPDVHSIMSVNPAKIWGDHVHVFCYAWLISFENEIVLKKNQPDIAEYMNMVPPRLTQD